MDYHAKERYAEAWMHLADPQKGDYAIMIAELDVLFLDKYLHLLPKNVPIIHGLRDPIGIFKHGIGRNWDKHAIEFEHDFTLSYDWRNFIEIIKHREYEIEVDFDGLAKGGFISAVLLPFFDAKRIYPLDMSRLSPENALDTMRELGEKFGFAPPEKARENFYGYKEFRGYIRYLVPLLLWARKEDKIFRLKDAPAAIDPTWIKPENPDGCFFFRIDRNSGDHICQMINIISELTDHSIKKDLGVYMTEEQWEELRKDEEFWGEIKGYLSEFVGAIAASTDEAEEKIFSEEDALEWLRGADKRLVLKLRTFFHIHMKFFKENFPEIVASWKYYAAFEDFCEEVCLGT